MRNEPKLHRFAPDGRYLGIVVQDQPIERYAPRMDVDLCTVAPPERIPGYWPYRVAGAWELIPDPLLPESDN